MTALSLGKRIELRNLSPTITGKDVDTMVSDALEFGLSGICVPPFWVKRASREIADGELSLCTVAGYPSGFQMTETKVLDAQLAIRDGANAVDFVFHHSSFANGMPWTKIELAKASHLLHQSSRYFQVTINTQHVASTQLSKACKLAVDAGADFISFFNPGGGWSTEDLRRIRGFVPSTVGLKLYVDINAVQEAEDLVAGGADLLSVSALDWLRR